jgi:hypothetical protein
VEFSDAPHGETNALLDRELELAVGRWRRKYNMESGGTRGGGKRLPSLHVVIRVRAPNLLRPEFRPRGHNAKQKGF